jgi:hypothetical protein
MTDFPPKGPANAPGTKLGQATTYIDPNNPSAGYQGQFNMVYSNQYIEKVSLCGIGTIASSSSERIHSNSISFGPECGTIYINVPETSNTLSELTLITRNRGYPSSVILNGQTRSVNWIGRNYEVNFSTQIVDSGETCSALPETEIDTACWSIISFKVYHGNLTQYPSDIIVFAYLEGQTFLKDNTLP